jgi:Tol biopolymer transport system component
VRIVDGSNEILRARLDDGAERSITTTPDREESWPYWSEPAQRLVFQVAGARGDSDLVLWSPETGETPQQKTPRREERWPTWSPTQPQLVYAFRGGRPPAGIAISDVATGDRRVIARSGARDVFFRPSFSPDGKRLVVQRRDPQEGGSDLWILATDAPPRALARSPKWIDNKPFFTRDGAQVLFTRRGAKSRRADVAIIAADGGEPRMLVHDRDAHDHSARPSPTRDEFAFVSDRDGKPEIFLADLDGGNVRKLTRSPDRHEIPRWSPDGERLVVLSTPADAAEPRLADRASLGRTRVVVLDREGRVHFDAAGFMADWMPPWR